MERPDTLTAFGDRIRKEREKRDLTQRDLAKASGLSRTTINRAERGIIELRIESAYQIADGLGIPLRDLFTDIP